MSLGIGYRSMFWKRIYLSPSIPVILYYKYHYIENEENECMNYVDFDRLINKEITYIYSVLKGQGRGVHAMRQKHVFIHKRLSQ